MYLFTSNPMMLIFKILFFIWDAVLYYKYIYPLWDSHLIFIIFFLPIGIVMARFFTKGDGKHRVKDLSILHTIIRAGITIVLYVIGGTQTDLLAKTTQNPDLFYIVTLVGAAAVLYTTFLFLNLIAIFSRPADIGK